ncbi:AzlD domain-containing protein [Pelagibacterium montanilacus]|uniref:AzlD domain-containing protein n=1 Tax=Pelagibacterium montanilacus TaxID=2185280 RepID=UPI000F8D638E|nr:AzlD domain-containing protein [Pelagibacterium montanilacus]
MTEALGAWWPFVVLVLVGIVPTEIWRIAAAVLARWIDEESEVFVLVRAIATAMVAGVITKLIIMPPPALSGVPLWARVVAVAAGLVTYFLARRSTPVGIAAGVVTIVTLVSLYAA